MATPNLSPNPATVTSPHERVPLVRILVVSGIALFLLVAIPVTKFFLWAKCFDLHAFHTPSASMCPAICLNEYFIAGMDAYNTRAPQRGEVILFDHDESGTKWIKRVIGVAGDTVARGPKNTILVNSTPLMLPPPCGKNNAYDRLASEGQSFETVKIPEGAIFVIGDNLDNSYDSRFFGVVRLDQVRGKPLLIYASSNASRIGCKIR
jgi:signal peptidase I